VVGHSLLPLGLAVAVLEAGAPLILRLFGAAYAEHATGLLRLVALAALPNLVTETAVYAARSQRRTAAAAAILAAVSIGVLGLTVVFLPMMGIVGVGVACMVAESMVAAVLLIRPAWWLHGRVPVPAGARDTRLLRARLSSRADVLLLIATVSLIVVGAILLAAGLLLRQIPVVLGSVLCAAVSAVALILFSRTNKNHASTRLEVRMPPSPVDETPLPIEAYDDLRVDEILPLLQELDLDRLQAMRAHEAAGQARATVLARIDLLVASAEESAWSRNDHEATFPIEGYDELRVVDILPLLPRLSTEELDAVAVREESGAMRVTVLSKIVRLHERAERARMEPLTSASDQ
jgi:hypothetical protein